MPPKKPVLFFAVGLVAVALVVGVAQQAKAVMRAIERAREM
jgi:hypothetical protein